MSRKIADIKEMTTKKEENEEWNNYKCTSCDRTTHQCPYCSSIERYKDTQVICTKCGGKS